MTDNCLSNQVYVESLQEVITLPHPPAPSRVRRAVCALFGAHKPWHPGHRMRSRCQGCGYPIERRSARGRWKVVPDA